MPIFEFACTCGYKFERLYTTVQSRWIAEAVCPSCGKLAAKTVSVPASPKFVGPGFYETDYKKTT
jgi:putative FmdB family regulatory protein